MPNTSLHSVRVLLAVLLGIVMVGCAAPTIDGGRRSRSDRESDEDAKGDDGSTADESRPASFAPMLPSTLVHTAAGTSRVSYVEQNGKRIAFGDIVLPPPPSGGKRVATAVGEVKVWPGGVVPYVVSSNDTAAVEAGIALWAAKTTGVTFVPRTNEADYIDVIKGQGCYSDIGRVGGRQELSIGDGCEAPHIVAHELGHAVGLWHEQSRADRDDFLIVRTENADPNMLHNFDKVTFQSIGAFDYDSIMLYSSFAFSNNNQATMLRSDGSEIADNQDVSASDGAGITALYVDGAAPTNEGGGVDDGQTIAPQPDETGAVTVTTTANVNLRAGPSTADEILFVIPNGSAVELTGEVSGNYVGVVFAGMAGWAHASYLQ